MIAGSVTAGMIGERPVPRESSHEARGPRWCRSPRPNLPPLAHLGTSPPRLAPWQRPDGSPAEAGRALQMPAASAASRTRYRRGSETATVRPVPGGHPEQRRRSRGNPDRGIQKSRDSERNRAQSHDSGDVNLKGSRHRLPRTLSDYPNLNPPPRAGNRSKRTRSLEVSSAGESDHGDAPERNQDARQLGLHREGPTSP